MNTSSNRRSESSTAQWCSLRCICRTRHAARSGSGHDSSPVFTGASVRDSLAASIPLGPFAMCEAFPRSDYYDPSAPPCGHRRTTRQPDPLTSGRGQHPGASRWFPRSLRTDRGGGCPAMPLRYRHGYAAAIHRGLRNQRPKRTPEFPTPDGVGAHRRPARIHRVRAGGRLERR